jgi:type II secretory pathway predicted ATPase ExeA
LSHEIERLEKEQARKMEALKLLAERETYFDKIINVNEMNEMSGNHSIDERLKDIELEEINK